MIGALDTKSLVRSGLVGVETRGICDVSVGLSLKIVVWDVTKGLGVVAVVLVVSNSAMELDSSCVVLDVG